MQCLNIKITYKCNNSCSYCFSSDLKEIELDIEELKLVIDKGYRKGCRGLIISGGEPTLDSVILREVIEYSYELGYRRYIIQTNGQGFIKENDNLKLIEEYSKITDMAISFSVLGSTEILHDSITRNKGSFNKLMISIKNISNTNCDIYTNTVISSLNYSDLKNIINLILPYNPKIMQFSVMHVLDKNPLSIGLVKSVEAINSIKNLISREIFRTEGIPYCLMKGFEKCVGESYWPSRLDLYNGNNDYKADFRQLDYNMRWKMDSCSKCILNDICHGVWSEHKDDFLKFNKTPIR